MPQLKAHKLQSILLGTSLFILMIIPAIVYMNFSLDTNLRILNDSTDLIFETKQILPKTFESVDYEYYINQIISSSLSNIKDHILNLSAFGSRVTGYSGYNQTINYILNFFTTQGLTNIQTHSYPLLIPMDYDTKIELKGANYTAHAFIPNSVHVNKISSSGLSGTLVYGGLGEYTDLDGKKIEDRIVVLEFESQDNWLNTVSLGAKAVIFLPTNNTNRFEAQSKSIEIPLEFPRIYIENETLAMIIKDLSMQSNQSITLYSDIEWKEINAKNIMGFLPGLDNEIIIISAYFDSSSCIPAISPGADEACGIATLLELIRIIKENNIIPQKSLMFLALSGHNQAAAGAREFVFQNYNNLNQNGGIRLFLSLDLSSSSNKIGINPYGYLYNFNLRYTTGNNLYNRLKSIGEEFFVQYSDEIQQYTNYSFEVESYTDYRDRFRHIAPITFIGDQEPFIASNVLALSFYTAETSRLRFNTPFDLPQHLDFEKLNAQVIYAISSLIQLINDKLLNNFLDLAPKDFSLKPTTHVGYGSIKGNCKEYGKNSASLTNVKDVIIRVNSRNPITGSFGIYSYYTRTDEDGFFQVRGISSSQPDNPLEFQVEAYAFNSEGKLIKANNLGFYGDFFGYSKKLIAREITVNPIIFECGTLGLFEVSHPYDQSISSESLTYKVIDPETRASLTSYGYKNQDSVILIFLPPHTRSNIIGTFDDKVLGVYATNSSLTSLGGDGFQVITGEFKNLGISAFVFLRDLHYKTQSYINLYTAHNIYDGDVKNTFEIASTQLNFLNQLKESNEYFTMLNELNNAQITSLNAFIQARNILEDAIFTALLFTIFLIPFSFILTIFLFNINSGLKGILIGSSLYSVTFLLFYFLHPGFKITPYIVLILIAIINVMGLLLVLLVFSLETFGVLKRIRKKSLGSHYNATSRVSAITLAFKTSIYRMKSQQFRTIMNIFGIVILTFSLTLFTSVGTNKVFNLLELGIPVSIAILLMINTSISTVYESKREISIFNSLGLTPTHITGLFLAEFLVHTILGSIFGYLGGIIGIRLFLTTGLITEPFSINFSSGVVVSVLIFSGLGILSSIIYPLRLSGRISVPSLQRSWEITSSPEKDGTSWNISLPFVVSDVNEAKGIITFLKEYFLVFKSENVGGLFFVRQITIKESTEEIHLVALLNLAPFDMGIVQKTDICLYYDKKNDHWKFIIKLARIEGVLHSWYALVKRFIGIIRQQLLIWTDLTKEDKMKYIVQNEKEKT